MSAPLILLHGDDGFGLDLALRAFAQSVDATERIVRGTVWTHLYSPAAARFDLSAQLDGSFAYTRAPFRSTKYSVPNGT